MKLMVVDDSIFSAEMLISLIGHDGVEFVKASSGTEALSLFTASAEGEIDAIFMDIIMDETPGNVVAEVIRKLDRADAGTVKLYATTAFQGFDMDGKSGAAFDGMLLKPYKKSDVTAIIESIKAGK